jgi:hypothetical protein
MDNESRFEHHNVATAVLECEVCYEQYDSGNHKPLCLTCGHTFCFSCISSLQKCLETRNCPKCKKKNTQTIDDMVINYALIPCEGKFKREKPQPEAPCLQHQKPLDYLCVDCMELTCFKCTRGTHATHKVEVIDDLLLIGEALGTKVKIRSKIRDQQKHVDSILSWIDEIVNLKTDFEEWKDSLLVQKETIEQDLQTWDDAVISTDENIRQKCKGILSRLKLEPAINAKLFKLNASLDAVSKKCKVSEITYIAGFYT